MKRYLFEDPDLTLEELMTHWPVSVSVFIKYRMHCVGCLIAPYHTIIDACIEHGVNEDDFRAELFHAIRGQS